MTCHPTDPTSPPAPQSAPEISIEDVIGALIDALPPEVCQEIGTALLGDDFSFAAASSGAGAFSEDDFAAAFADAFAGSINLVTDEDGGHLDIAFSVSEAGSIVAGDDAVAFADAFSFAASVDFDIENGDVEITNAVGASAESHALAVTDDGALVVAEASAETTTFAITEDGGTTTALATADADAGVAVGPNGEVVATATAEASAGLFGFPSEEGPSHFAEALSAAESFGVPGGGAFAGGFAGAGGFGGLFGEPETGSFAFASSFAEAVAGGGFGIPLPEGAGETLPEDTGLPLGDCWTPPPAPVDLGHPCGH